MKGTILDFLKLASEKPELAKGLVELAAKHDFEFVVEELTDAELDNVSGGTILSGGWQPKVVQPTTTPDIRLKWNGTAEADGTAVDMGISSTEQSNLELLAAKLALPDN